MSNAFLPVTFLALCCGASASYVSVTSNTYQDVVIRIDEDVTSDCQSVVEDIKAIVQNMSTAWSRALDSPLSFGNVTIIAPNSWRSECQALLNANGSSEFSWVRPHRADFVITPSHPVFDLLPFSFQYGDCGDPALPIIVPWSGNSTDVSRAKRLVREWAHYRYGVFDEGGQPYDDRHPSAYMAYQTQGSSQRSVANTCSEKKMPRGHWSEGNCQTNANSSCEFLPDTQNPGIYSSLMYRPDLSHIEKFCDDTNHDPVVPSKLNFFCDGKSASAIIKQHSDYKVPSSGSGSNTTLNVIANPFMGYHIILDVCSFDNATFSYSRKSLIQFISHLPDAVVLSIDLFNSTLITYLQPVALDKDTKINLMANLSGLYSKQDASNYQGLGRALDNGLLRAQDGLDIIMMTKLPAKLTTLQNFNDYVIRYQANKVNFHLIYYPPVTSKDLVQLADLAVYGSFHYIPNSDPPIDNWLNGLTWSVGTLQSIFGRTFSRRIKLYEISMKREQGTDTTKTGKFFLDSPASKLLFSLYFINSDGNLAVNDFRLTHPNGQSVDITEINDFVNDNEEMFLFRIKAEDLAPGAGSGTLEQGVWGYEIKLSSGSATGMIRLDIWMEPADRETFIEILTWNSAVNCKPWDASVKPIGLYAQLTQNRKPVHGASVTAHVYAITESRVSSTEVTSIQLLDNGLADVTTGDGIYSAWLTVFSNASLAYAIKYEVNNVNNSTLVDNGTYERQPTTGSVISMSTPVPAVEQLTRFEYGPGFQLTSSTSSNVDYIPPARIVDFSIASYSQSTGNLVLTWTPPRDNYGSGPPVTRFALIKTTATGTEEEKFTADATNEYGRLNRTTQVPSVEAGGYVSFRIYAIDGNNNKGKSSNVISVMGPLPPDGLSATAWGLIGAAIVIVVIILVILLVCYLCPDKARARKRQAAKTVRQIFEAPATTNKSNERKDSSEDGRSEVHDWRTVESIAAQSRAQQRAAEQPRSAGSSRAPSVSIQGSERVYFGQRDIDEMTSGRRSDNGSFDGSVYERGTEEVIKRAPSMNLQLAAILERNNSNLSLDRAGVSDQPLPQQSRPKPEVIIQPKVYKTRPVSQQSYGSLPITGAAVPRPLSTSETNLYHQTDVVTMRPNLAGSTVSSPSNSYMSVFAEPRTEVARAQSQQPVPTGNRQSRPDLRNGDWNDQTPFSYTDARLAGQPRGQSSFDPVNHPANQIGLPLGPPPPVPRGFQHGDSGSVSSSVSSQSDRLGAKPKRVSAV